jgi:hypothetical protein
MRHVLWRTNHGPNEVNGIKYVHICFKGIYLAIVMDVFTHSFKGGS